MKRNTFGIVLLSAMLAMPAAGMSAEQEVSSEPAAVPAPQTHEHTVVKGDTLWDISGEYMQAPYLWPEVWKLNPGIKDPDRIYPGEKIVLPGPVPPSRPKAAGEKAPEKDSLMDRAVSTAKPGGKPSKPAPNFFGEEPLVNIGETMLLMPEDKEKRVISLDAAAAKPKVPIAEEGTILEAGFILDHINTGMHITGSPLGERNVFSMTEQVYTLPDPSINLGDTLISYRPDSEVIHPATGRPIGTLIKITGLLRAVKRADGFMVCEVVATVNDIRDGDYLMPYAVPEPVFEPVPRNPRLKGEWGYIVAGTDNRELSAQEYTVYLDLGKDDGVKPGDAFVIKTQGGTTAVDDKSFVLPDIVIGEVQVIEVQDATSTAKVLSFTDAVRPGQRVYYQD